jgi:hypothetical protein
MLMMDYFTISLAVVVCLVIWWSFLAVSGLKESGPDRLKANAVCQKKKIAQTQSN